MENWKPYKFLWTRIGGKPWTTLVRIFCYAKRNFLPLMLSVATLGWVIGRFVKDNKILVAITATLLLGILLGHFFW